MTQLKAMIPIERGLFQLPEDPGGRPALLGSRCDTCGESFWPRRRLCACCSKPCTETLLSQSGTLYTFTKVHMGGPGGAAYYVGQVDLPEGSRIQAILTGDPTKICIGAEVAIALHPTDEDSEGNTLVSFCFQPVVK